MSRRARAPARPSRDKPALAAPADGERRAASRADQEIGLALEEKRERESALEPRERGGDGVAAASRPAKLFRDEMGDDLGVGLRGEDVALGRQFLAQLAEILDNAIVNDRDAFAGVRMGVGLVRLAVRRPARVADADRAGKRRAGELLLEILAACRWPAGGSELAIFQRRDRRRSHSRDIRGASALRRIAARNRTPSQYADNATHNCLRGRL